MNSSSSFSLTARAFSAHRHNFHSISRAFHMFEARERLIRRRQQCHTVDAIIVGLLCRISFCLSLRFALYHCPNEICRLRERMGDRHNGPNRAEILYSTLMTNFSFAFVCARTELVHAHVWLRVCCGASNKANSKRISTQTRIHSNWCCSFGDDREVSQTPSSQAKRSSSHDAFIRHRVTHTNWQANVIQAMISNCLWNIHDSMAIQYTSISIHFSFYISFWDIDVLFVFNLQRLVFAPVRAVNDAGPKQSTRTKTRQFTEHILIRLVHGRMYSMRRRIQKAKNVKVDLYRCERFIEHDACGRCFRNFLLENNEIKSFNVFHASLFLL